MAHEYFIILLKDEFRIVTQTKKAFLFKLNDEEYWIPKQFCCLSKCGGALKIKYRPYFSDPSPRIQNLYYYINNNCVYKYSQMSVAETEEFEESMASQINGRSE